MCNISKQSISESSKPHNPKGYIRNTLRTLLISSIAFPAEPKVTHRILRLCKNLDKCYSATTYSRAIRNRNVYALYKNKYVFIAIPKGSRRAGNAKFAAAQSLNAFHVFPDDRNKWSSRFIDTSNGYYDFYYFFIHLRSYSHRGRRIRAAKKI